MIGLNKLSWQTVILWIHVQNSEYFQVLCKLNGTGFIMFSTQCYGKVPTTVPRIFLMLKGENNKIKEIGKLKELGYLGMIIINI